jgi:formamidopyrimidine-DNA glycosylase
MEQDSAIHHQIIVVRCEERQCDICGTVIATNSISDRNKER